MTEPISTLYNRKILALAAAIPCLGHLDAPDAQADAVSRLCGSKVHVEINVTNGLVTGFAQDIQACALGQTAASVIGGHILGAPIDDVRTARAATLAMLKGAGEGPDGRFEELRLLAPVKDYPGRHGSVMLVFDALEKAIASLND